MKIDEDNVKSKKCVGPFYGAERKLMAAYAMNQRLGRLRQQRDELRSELAKLQVKSKSQEMLNESLTKVQAEIKAQYPSLKSVAVGLALKAEAKIVWKRDAE